MFSACLGCFHWVAGWIGLFAFLSYVLPILAIAVLPVPNLKKKYGAKIEPVGCTLPAAIDAQKIHVTAV